MGASATRQECGSHEFPDSAAIIPRLCYIQKKPGDIYGFHLHAEKDMVGYIVKVDEGSPAEDSGLKRGDRVLQVNGHSVSSDSFFGIADRILERADIVELLVVAPAPGDRLPQMVWAEEQRIALLTSQKPSMDETTAFSMKNSNQNTAPVDLKSESDIDKKNR